MALNLFGPPTKDDIKVAYIDPILGLVGGVSICEANEYAKKEPGTTFIFRNGNQTLQYLNVNEINQLDPNVLTTTDNCGGISQKKECGPPTIQIFGGGGIGAAGNPIVGNDGAILAVDIIRGGNGYQYPPLVSARDICNYGSGATFTTVIGEVVETTETFDNEADFEDYELCDPTDVGYGQNWGPDGEDLGSWDPKVYTEPGEDPIRNEVIKFQEIVRKLARTPFWTTRKNKPTKITCSDLRVIPSKYDVTFPAWNEFMNSYAISPVSPSNVRGSDFAGKLFTFEWTEEFPTDGEYIFRGLCDNNAQLYVNNLKIADLAGFDAPVRPIQKTFKKGIYNIRVDLLNIPLLETVTTQLSESSNSSDLKVRKVFNTVDLISKANRTLWRTNPIASVGDSLINQFGVSPFDTTSQEAQTNSFAGTHTIIWSNINFPVDGSYRIRMAVDDNVRLFIGEEEIIYNGFVESGANRDFNESRIFKAGNYTIRAELEQIEVGPLGSGRNPMALAIDIETTTTTKTIVSSRSWNDNPMGISVTIDAPEPKIPQEPILEQEGRCPNNPIWSTRFAGAKEFWYPVQFNGSKSPQGAKEPWSKFFNRYAISPVRPLDTPGSDAGGVVFANSWSLEIPYDGFYQFAVQRDNTARFYVDGNLAFDVKTSGDARWVDFRNKPKFQKVFITRGRHTISVELENNKSQVFNQVNQKIFRTKDWQSGSISNNGVTYEGPPLFAYKNNQWGKFMNNHSVSPFLPPLDSENPEINGVKRYTWKGANFPESGQYDVVFQADNNADLIIGGVKVLTSQGFAENSQIFKVNITQGKYDITVECNNIPNRTSIFTNNPTGFGLVISKNISVLREGSGKSWDENPIGVGAILIPPPCPRRIRGKGVVTDIIVNDPGNGYLPPIAPTTTPPSTLALIQTNVPGVPGGGAGAGAGGGTGIPGVGAPGVGAPGAGAPGVPAVPLSIPSPPSGAPTGINASFRPQFEVVRDPVVIDPQKLLQVTDLVGLKQTGYVNGRAYYGAVYYDKGIRYAGFYETVGEPIQIYDTLRESILAQVITPPSAILRQGTDIRSNDPLLNIPGTVQSTLSSNSIVGAGDIFPPSVPFVQEPVQDSIYPVSLRLKRVLVEDPGINYNVTDQIRVIPSNGAILEPVFGSFGRIIKVAVIDPGFGFTEYPRIEMFTPL
jgi:hypothetical protein